MLILESCFSAREEHINEVQRIFENMNVKCQNLKKDKRPFHTERSMECQAWKIDRICIPIHYSDI